MGKRRFRIRERIYPGGDVTVHVAMSLGLVVVTLMMMILTTSAARAQSFHAGFGLSGDALAAAGERYVAFGLLTMMFAAMLAAAAFLWRKLLRRAGIAAPDRNPIRVRTGQ